MYCPQCGTQNDASAAFCGNCGEKLSGAVNQTTTAQDSSNTPQINVKPVVKYSNNPVLNELKKFAASPLALVSVIAFTLGIIIYISNAKSISSTIINYLSDISEELGYYGGFYEIEEFLSSGLDSFYRAFAVISMIPNIVIATGMWITIYCAFNKSSDDMSTAGLKTIKVIYLISMIFTIIGAVIYTIFAISIIAAIVDAGNKVPAILIVIFVLIWAAIIFRIYYLKKILDLINTIVYSFASKYPAAIGSFVAVMTFITGGVNIISALVSGSLSDWCFTIATICFGLLILKYKRVIAPLRINTQR